MTLDNFSTPEILSLYKEFLDEMSFILKFSYQSIKHDYHIVKTLFMTLILLFEICPKSTLSKVTPAEGNYKGHFQDKMYFSDYVNTQHCSQITSKYHIHDIFQDDLSPQCDLVNQTLCYYIVAL